MVSDSDIVTRLREFLRTSNLNTTTTAIVRRRLEEDFGIDLSNKKAFIREQVDLFLQSQLEKGEENEAEEEEEQEGDNEEEDESNVSNSKEEGEGEEDDEEENKKAKVKVESNLSNSKSEEDEEEEEDDADDVEEEEETSNGKGSAKKRPKKQSIEVKKRRGGFNKLCSLSPQLQEFTGTPEMARTEVVKQLWAYIREKDLQDPSNRRNIMCDDTLRALFGVNSINMFQMNKALAKHIWPLESDDAAPVISTTKERQRKRERNEDADEPKRKVKRTKGGNSGFLAPLQLSEALVKFLGTGENALSRSEVVKRIWDYIKQNDLQDPSDKRRILCDEKLKELFDVESFNGFTVSKLLTAHLTKMEL